MISTDRLRTRVLGSRRVDASRTVSERERVNQSSPREWSRWETSDMDGQTREGELFGRKASQAGARWTSAAWPQAENEARGKRCDMDAARQGERWEVRINGDVRVNALAKKWVDSTREKLGQPTDLQLLQKTFDRMK